jgi:hypothetical protein
LQGSFVADVYDFTDAEYSTMIDSWINIEDEPEVQNAIIEEELEELERSAKPAAADDAGDDDKPKSMELEIGESDLLSYIEAVDVLHKLSLSAPSLVSVRQQQVILIALLRLFTLPKPKKPSVPQLSIHYFLRNERTADDKL